MGKKKAINGDGTLNISQSDFIDALERARQKAGSIDQLSKHVSITGRTLQNWLAGQGPNRRHMSEYYPIFIKIASGA